VTVTGSDGTANACIAIFEGGNVKDFQLVNVDTSYCRYGYRSTLGAGVVHISYGEILGTVASIASYGENLTVQSQEPETTGSRWIVGGNYGQLTIINSSFQGSANADDVVIDYGGQLVMLGSSLSNFRTGSSYPKIVLEPSYFLYSYQPAESGLESIGNFYQNAPSGYIPVYDGSGNLALPNYYANQPVEVMSIGDTGGSGDSKIYLKNYIPLSFIASQTASSVSTASVLNCGNTDSCIGWRNNAGTGNVTISKDTSDVLHLGGSAGIVTNGNAGIGTTSPQVTLDTAGQDRRKPVTFATLTACSGTIEGETAAVTDSTTNTWGATITGSGSDPVLAYCDGTNWTVAGK
jgi:hypothetical protein